jgi:PmbA protein
MTPAKRAAKRGARRTPVRKAVRAPRTTGEEMGQTLLAEAERIVQRALALGASQAEGFCEAGAGVQVELESDRIASTGASQGSGRAVRLIAGGRVGFAYFTRAAELDGAIRLALAQAKHAPAKGYSLPMPGKAKALAGRWDARIAALSVDDAIAAARDVLAGAKEGAPKATVAGGGVGLDWGEVALASSQGVACHDRWTQASVGASLVLQDGERSVSASESRDAHRFKIDGHAVALEAAETVVSLKGPKPAKAGRMDVVFRPEAVAELVVDLAVSAATGDEARRGKTVWSEKLGAQVAARGLDLADDSRVAGAIGGAPFDDEGLPTSRLPILEDGVLRNFIYDSWDAHEHKATSTASAVRGGFKSRPEAGTHHVVLSSRSARPTDKILAGVDDGYLVESVLGAHTANATTGDFSVTAPNVWRIRKGAVAGPAKEIALGGNLPDLLLRLDGVGKEAKRMDGLSIPVLRFQGMDVSV